jgi:hypothetical protein
MYPASSGHTFVVDLTQPAATDVSPDDGAAGTSVNEPIVMIFNRSVDTPSLSYTVSPDPGGWSANWSNDNRMVILNHNPFELGTEYTITLSHLRDDVGHTLSGAPFTWSFRVDYRVYLPMAPK